MTLGERIQEIRLKNHLSQEQFGALLGTTRQSVSRWELDQALPELEKIVKIARLFAVTTDSLLLDGVDTFVETDGAVLCTVSRLGEREIVETERFVLDLADTGDTLTASLYEGNRIGKRCVAAIVHDKRTDSTVGAGMYAGGRAWAFGEADVLVPQIGTAWLTPRGMHTVERFTVVSPHEALPSVSSVGIGAALRAWRMGATYQNDGGQVELFFCTAEVEYIFSVRPDYADVYVGASWNVPFELGLYGGHQYFRIRDAAEKQPYCNAGASFAAKKPIHSIPTAEAQIGQCVRTKEGYLWCVKRYTEDEIVLAGCGDDEYRYARDKDYAERYAPLL